MYPTLTLSLRFGHGSAELENSLYVVGGHTAIAGVFPASPSVSLKQVSKTKTSSSRGNTVVLSTLFNTCTLPCFQVERYDPLSNKWTMMAPLRDGVSNAAVVSAKLKLFVFGGSTIHRDKASKVELLKTEHSQTLACIKFGDVYHIPKIVKSRPVIVTVKLTLPSPEIKQFKKAAQTKVHDTFDHRCDDRAVYD